MANSAPTYATLDDWIAAEAIAFSLDSVQNFNAAVDKVIDSLGEKVEILGFGEALHGGDELLVMRNQLFQRLVEAHGYSAIAIESSFPQGRLTNEYVLGRGPATYAAVQEAGFSHGFGKFEANRELIEWMKEYNADPDQPVKLQFYGMDSPTDVPVTDSPRQCLTFALDYFSSIDTTTGQKFRNRIEAVLGNDADWENPTVIFEPEKSIALSAEAKALRLETEELIAELQVRRPELVAKSGRASYLEAVQFAREARQLLYYHAVLAVPADNRQTRLLDIRAAIMADNMEYIVRREQGRGKTLIFAHNSHLKRGNVEWQMGNEKITWWPVGSRLNEMFGDRYAIIATGLGESAANGIGQPEAGTLEARLTATAGPGRFIPTFLGQGLNAEEIVGLPVRTGSKKNRSYIEPFKPQSFSDFDWLAVLDSATYNRGGPKLEEWGARPEK